MTKKSQYIDIEIDNLTNSLENVITGDNFPTDVVITVKNDFKSITKKKGGSSIGKLNFRNLIGTYISSLLLTIRLLFKV